MISMNYYRMKIKERFIEPIRNGAKRHEYRLATKERKQIKIGDVLILSNNQDRTDYVEVVVNKIEYFSSWEDALQIYWESDFKGYFDTLEEAIKECNKFYSRDEVREFGIEVFGIEPRLIELKNSNVLLDTNIVIHRESSNNIAYEVMQLYKSLDKLKVNKCVLDDIKDEIKRYKNSEIVNNMLAKIDSYNCIQPKDISDIYFKEVVSKYSQNENSQIDNKFLYQVYSGCVDFLITDDKGILAKAKELLINNYVLSTTDFLGLIEKRYPSLITYKVLSVNLAKISSLDINDEFFDSLREDYEGIKFNRWFEKKAKEGEDAYVFKNGKGKLQGFLYLKIENEQESYSDIKPKFVPKRRLKVGTFKINSTGLRIGERFLKIIFDYALKSEVEEIYVTLFEDKRKEVIALMNLMISWGFEKHGYKTNKELVLVKKMGVYCYDKDPKYNYPNLKANVSYGILPIDAQFHTDLFPDLFIKNENMTLFEEKPCGYAVEKIYVCGTKSVPRKPGDLMAIYRMSEKYYKSYNSVVSGICILQDVIYPKSYEEYLKVCNNRSVFSENQLKSFYYEKGYHTVLKVLFLKPLDKKIILHDLKQNNIIDENKGPRLTTTISKDKFDKLLELGGAK